MSDAKTRSGAVNGDLWGRKAAEWARFQEPTLSGVFDDVLSRTGVQPGTQYLDLGCGAGLAASKAGALGANVTGLDASEPLLNIARSRLPGGNFVQGDLEDLPFDTGHFNVVTSFNGIQYAANPVLALRQAARVTAPDGQIALVTWAEPDGMEAAGIIAALKPLLPPPPPNAPGPFSLSDSDILAEFARDGGLDVIDIRNVDCPWIYPDLDSAIRGLGSSGVAAKAIDAVGQDVVDDAHRAAITPYIQPDGSLLIGASFKVLLARPA